MSATVGTVAGVPDDAISSLGNALRSRVWEDALVRDMEDRRPELFRILLALGVVERAIKALVPANGPASVFIERKLELGEIPDVIFSPVAHLQSLYGWGGATFDPTVLFAVLDTLSTAAGVESTVDTSSGSPVLNTVLGTFSGSPPAPPGGVRIIPAFVIPSGITLSLPITPGITAQIGASLQVDPAVTIDITPPINVAIGAAAPSGGKLTTGVQFSPVAPDTALVIWGITGKGRVEAAGITASVTAQFDVSGGHVSASPGFEIDVNNAQAVFGLGDADAFSQSTIGANSGSAGLSFKVLWSPGQGARFDGAGTFEIKIPVSANLGVAKISGVALSLQGSQSSLVLAVTADVIVLLGPVQGTISQLGIAGTVSFSDGGNLGGVGFDAHFQPPSGVGLSVDAGSVHGGGFISFDSTAGRYFGGLQLSIYDISVSAFALIETKVPNVDFSFVIVISAQFTPIQLGFGFTLNGVGGMVGINRGIDTNALASLVRAGQSEELLFPKNVISDAPTIVKDLTAVFPATQGQYVFGPLGKLGWGTPTLITGEIGIILEYPAMVVVLLGEVKCLLPKPDQALVKLNLSIDGVLDFPNKTFSMDADLHDSVINGFPVSGQMAMRVSWGDQPNFVFSIGGFHPAYTPPPNFPKLQPMTLDLGSHGPAKISVSGFFAVTSNTVQVGGTAKLHAGGSGITLDASVSVKALFVFQPFSFEADIDASVSISFHGYGPSVHLSGQLDGPSPWHIKGEVCVSIIWWDACLGFDVTFGGDTQITQPSVDPWLGVASSDPTVAIVGLQTALSDPGNWSGALIPGTVSSVARAQGTDTLVDPVGGLTVRQKTAPVETPNPLTKFGVAKTTKPITFSKVQATLGTAPNTVSLTAVEAVNEDFAPAQFFDMDDGKKLSSAGFEQYQAGYLFATADGKNAEGGSSVTFQPKTRTLVINSDGTDTEFDDDSMPTDAQVTAFNKQSAIAKGGLAQAGTRRFVNRAFAQSFSQVLPTFVITDTTTLAAPTNPTVPAPAAAVRSATLIALDAFRTQNVELALNVQVAALHDMPPTV